MKAKGFLPGVVLILTTVFVIKAVIDLGKNYGGFFGFGKLHISPLIPPVIQVGHEWRFEGTPTSIGNCSYFSAFNGQFLPEINRGYNKVVFRGFDDQTVIKRIAFNGIAFVDCMDEAEGDLNSEYKCVEEAATSFITEIGILLKLQGDLNVPKLFAYCIPLDFMSQAEAMASSTSAGQPLDIIHLAQSDWSERVRILDEILRFLQRTRPLLFRDFRRQQFVLIQNRPSMVDFDDVIHTNNATDHEIILKNIYTSFIDEILFASSPSAARPALAEIKDLYANETLTLEKLFHITKKLRAFT